MVVIIAASSPSIESIATIATSTTIIIESKEIIGAVTKGDVCGPGAD